MVLEEAVELSINFQFWAEIIGVAVVVLLFVFLVFHAYPHYKRKQALKSTNGKQSATPQPHTNPKLRGW